MKTKKKLQIDLDPPPATAVRWTVITPAGEQKRVRAQTAYYAWRRLALPLRFGAYTYIPDKE